MVEEFRRLCHNIVDMALSAALLVLILVIASFTSVVASTFQSTVDANGNPYDFITVGMDNASGNASTATRACCSSS